MTDTQKLIADLWKLKKNIADHTLKGNNNIAFLLGQILSRHTAKDGTK